MEGHERIHDMLKRQNQKMTYTSTVDRIGFLKPDIALVHARWEWPGSAHLDTAPPRMMK